MYSSHNQYILSISTAEQPMQEVVNLETSEEH